MGAYKDESKNGTWFCKFTYTNWKGEKINKKKRGFATKKLGACVDYTEEEMKSLLFKRSCMDEQDYQWDKAYDVNLNLLLRKDTNEDNREDNFWGSYSVGRIIACEALEVNVSEDNTDE